MVASILLTALVRFVLNSAASQEQRVPILPLFYFAIALLIACLIWLIAFEEVKRGKEVCVPDDNRKDKDQAQAEAGCAAGPTRRTASAGFAVARSSKNRQNEAQQQAKITHSTSSKRLSTTSHSEKPKPMVGWLLLGCVVLLASIVVLIAVKAPARGRESPYGRCPGPRELHRRGAPGGRAHHGVAHSG